MSVVYLFTCLALTDASGLVKDRKNTEMPSRNTSQGSCYFAHTCNTEEEQTLNQSFSND